MYRSVKGDMIQVMLNLRLKNPLPEHLAHHAHYPGLSEDVPLKPRIEAVTARQFQIVSPPQRDGSFVASIAEDPKIVVYDRSRKAAEGKAAKKFLATPDRWAYTRHPLSVTKAVTIEMEYDGDAEAFVTFVKELHRMSTFGSNEEEALDNTAEMIRGYIKSMETNRKKIRLSAARLAELKGAVGLR